MYGGAAIGLKMVVKTKVESELAQGEETLVAPQNSDEDSWDPERKVCEGW